MLCGLAPPLRRAIAIVGYDADGFWALNPLGTSWGPTVSLTDAIMTGPRQ